MTSQEAVAVASSTVAGSRLAVNHNQSSLCSSSRLCSSCSSISQSSIACKLMTYSSCLWRYAAFAAHCQVRIRLYFFLLDFSCMICLSVQQFPGVTLADATCCIQYCCCMARCLAGTPSYKCYAAWSGHKCRETFTALSEAHGHPKLPFGWSWSRRRLSRANCQCVLLYVTASSCAIHVL